MLTVDVRGSRLVVDDRMSLWRLERDERDDERNFSDEHNYLSGSCSMAYAHSYSSFLGAPIVVYEPRLSTIHSTLQCLLVMV